MKKLTSYVMAVATLFAAVSCNNQGFKKTKSGLQYKIISDGKGDVVKRGQYLKVTFVQKVHDSVLSSSSNGFPTYIPVDSVGPVYAPAEVFGLLRKGDSAIIVLEVDTLLRKSGGQLPPFLKKKDKITLALRVEDIFVNNELVKQDRDKYLDVEKQKEIKQIEEYLSKNNITGAKMTKGGVYYQILTEGSGPRVDSGKIVAIRYTGYDMEGKPFDSNTDSTKQSQAHSMAPYEFKAGVSGAISGMVEAVLQFKKGDKGKIFVPAMLGYGPQGAGNVIKPFENLIFDMEVVDIKDAPSAPSPAFKTSPGMSSQPSVKKK